MDFRTTRSRISSPTSRPGASRRGNSSSTHSPGSTTLNPRVNAFVAVDADGALAAADDVDRRVAAGEEVGPLAGIPIGVKDLEDAVGFVTTDGSATHAHDAPSTRDSVLVSRLQGRRRDRRRQDQHARVRAQAPDRQSDLRHHPQPVGPGAHTGRLVGWNVGGARVRDGAARDRVGRRWVDPHPVVGDRAVRAEAVARTGPHGRPGRAGMAPPLHPWRHGSPHP